MSSWKDSYHVESFSLIFREAHVTLKAWFQWRRLYHWVICTGSHSNGICKHCSLWISHFLGLWFRDHLHWWTNSSILKENSPLLWKEPSLSPFTEASLRVGGSLEASTAIGLWNQEESRLLITTLYSRKLCCYLNMIQKSAYELKSVDFHRQFFSGCLCEQPGRLPLGEYVP